MTTIPFSSSSYSSSSSRTVTERDERDGHTQSRVTASSDGSTPSPTDRLQGWELERSLVVLRAVSRRTQVPVEAILGRSRLAEPVHARRLAVFGLRHHVGLGWSMLAQIVGHRPDTVLDTVRHLERRARIDPATRLELDGLLEELGS